MGDSNLFGAKVPAKPHLLRGSGGLQAEIQDLRKDIDEAFVTLEGDGGFLFTEEFINPVAADTDAIKLNIATVAALTAYAVADLDGAVGAGEMVPPRNFSITGDGDADIDAVTVTVTGTIRNKVGKLVTQSDTIAVTDALNGTLSTNEAFSTIVSISIPAQSGTGGTFEFGFGDIIGLARPLKARNGVFPEQEIVNGRLAGVDNLVTEEFTDPVAADTNAIKLAIASVAAPVTYSGADLDGIIGEGEMIPPRNFTLLTGATTADIAASTVNVIGTVRDEYGVLVPQTDALTVSVNQAGATLGTSPFAFITSIEIDTAQDGTSATYEFGLGDLIGLTRGIKTRAGLTAPIREVEAGSEVTTGTFTTAAAEPPQGTYLPGTVADASNDYALTFEAIDDAGAFVLPATSPPHGTYTPLSAPDGVSDYQVTYAVDPAI